MSKGFWDLHDRYQEKINEKLKLKDDYRESLKIIIDLTNDDTKTDAEKVEVIRNISEMLLKNLMNRHS